MLHGIKGGVGRGYGRDQFFLWIVGMVLHIVNDSTEIGRLGIARTADIQFFLHEEFGDKLGSGLGIADENYTACESNFIDSLVLREGRTYPVISSSRACRSSLAVFTT